MVKRDDRRQEIINMLIEHNAVDLDDLAERFAVSKMTIHRDLDNLEQTGVLRKVRGGATIEPGTQFESDFRFRKMQEPEVKTVVAKVALDLVEPGMAVIVNDGSMSAVLGGMLMEKRPLTIITNNAAIMEQVSGESDITLIALGGIYSAKFNAYFGLSTEEALSRLHADISFISTPAADGGVAYHMEESVVRTKRAMMKASNKRCLLINNRRFGHTGLYVLAELKEFDTIISDRPLPSETKTALAQTDIDVRIAPHEG